MREVVEAARLPVALPCCIDQGQIPRRACSRQLVVGRQVERLERNGNLFGESDADEAARRNRIAVVDEPNGLVRRHDLAFANRALRPAHACTSLANGAHTGDHCTGVAPAGSTRKRRLGQRDHGRIMHLPDAAIDAREARAGGGRVLANLAMATLPAPLASAGAFTFDNSFARELQGSTSLDGLRSCRAPRLLFLNGPLAEELGLDLASLETPRRPRYSRAIRCPTAPNRWLRPTPATSSAASRRNSATAARFSSAR